MSFSAYSAAKTQLAEISVELQKLRDVRQKAFLHRKLAWQAASEEMDIRHAWSYGFSDHPDELKRKRDGRLAEMAELELKYGGDVETLMNNVDRRLTSGWYDQRINYLEEEASRLEWEISAYEASLDQAEEDQIERLHNHEKELAFSYFFKGILPIFIRLKTMSKAISNKL